MHLSFLTGDEFWGSSVDYHLKETNVHHDAECKYLEYSWVHHFVGGWVGVEGGGVIGGGGMSTHTTSKM